MPDETPQECRHDVLAYLAERPRLPFPAKTIQEMLARRGLRWSPEAIKAALDFLTGFTWSPGAGQPAAPLVESTPDPFGPELVYAATTTGILFHERH